MQHCIHTKCRIGVPSGEHISHVAAHSLRVIGEVQRLQGEQYSLYDSSNHIH